jgi:hypothetical protein
MDVLYVGLFFTGLMVSITAAVHVPKKKVKWGDVTAPRVVTHLYMKRKTSNDAEL